MTAGLTLLTAPMLRTQCGRERQWTLLSQLPFKLTRLYRNSISSVSFSFQDNFGVYVLVKGKSFSVDWSDVFPQSLSLPPPSPFHDEASQMQKLGLMFSRLSRAIKGFLLFKLMVGQNFTLPCQEL